MERAALAQLERWYHKPQRKPMLIDGARQAGKTYLVEQVFGPKYFQRVITLDFWEDKQLTTLFDPSLKPDHILEEIELYFGITLDLNRDLLFFDEIGHCQPAMDALKYFAQQRPDIWLCASGSNIGLLGSFPVGKIEFLHLSPLTFEEFLTASGEPALVRAYRGLRRTRPTHDRLWQAMLDYWFVGGLPEVVAAWFAPDTLSKRERINKVRELQHELLTGYSQDFGKVVKPPSAALQIQAVFDNVPRQLSRDVDGNVKRYRFGGIIKGKKDYRALSGPIQALEKLSLVSKNFPVRCKPSTPLLSYSDDNHFKLFLFDIGLLSCMLNLTYAEIQQQSTEFKGYIAENFVHNEWVAGLPAKQRHTFSWKENTSEIEFLVADEAGSIAPVEVKSGKRSQAKSIKAYCDRYAPARHAKLIGGIGAGEERKELTWPLYYAAALNEKLRQSGRSE